MADPHLQDSTPLEDSEVQRTQFDAASNSAEQRHTFSRRQGSKLVSQLSGRSLMSRSMFPTQGPQLARLSSSVGPVTDSRGLGSLAAYVLPGMLRNASMARPFDRQTSALQVFSSQSLSDDTRSLAESALERQYTDNGRGRPRASTAPGQQPQGTSHQLLDSLLLWVLCK